MIKIEMIKTSQKRSIFVLLLEKNEKNGKKYEKANIRTLKDHGA